MSGVGRETPTTGLLGVLLDSTVLQKSFLNPQHVISLLNKWGKNENPHRLGASGSFQALSFHVGLKSGVTNSKKIEKM
jgi:hypothetical protein